MVGPITHERGKIRATRINPMEGRIDEISLRSTESILLHSVEITVVQESGTNQLHCRYLSQKPPVLKINRSYTGDFYFAVETSTPILVDFQSNEALK